MKKITIAYRRFGGEPVAAFVSGERAVITTDLLGRDISLVEVPVLDAESYTMLNDLEDMEGGGNDGI